MDRFGRYLHLVDVIVYCISASIQVYPAGIISLVVFLRLTIEGLTVQKMAKRPYQAGIETGPAFNFCSCSAIPKIGNRD